MFCKGKIACCLLTGFLLAGPSYGQYKLEQAVEIGREQGMPNTEIRSIAKSKDGFIWIGTADGLCRFDGQQIKLFPLADSGLTASFDNMVNAVLPVDNEVWMGTNQGISVLNTTDESLRHYQLGETHKADSVVRAFYQSVVVVYQDRQGDLWFGTRDKGAWIYDRKKDDFKKFSYPPSAYQRIIPLLDSRESILSIEASETNDSIIWTGTTAGLQEINKYSGKVSWYTFPKPDKDYQVSLNAFRRLCHASDGLLYVGSWGAGVNVFDPIKKTFTPLVLTKPDGKKILDGPVSRILPKSKDELWITTIQGLGVYNIREKAITWYQFNELLKHEFYGVDYIDEANRIWQVNIKGVQYFDPTVQQFSTYSFEHLFDKEYAYAFYIVPDDATGNNVTVCPRISNGLYHFNKTTRQWKKSPFRELAAMGFEQVTVRGFAEISPGRYFISADEGLFSYSMASRTLSVIRQHPKAEFRQWGEALKDRSGNLWLAADADGLFRWNLNNNKSRLFKSELLDNDENVGYGKIVHLFEDSRQNIWFSRAGGFSVHLADSDSMVNFIYVKDSSNSFPFVNNFAEDKNGRVWVASGDGYYGYIDVNNPRKGIQRKFDLKDNNIRGHFVFLAKGRDGNVWANTYKELVRINADDLSLSIFSFEYGNRAADFFHFSFLPSGDIVFGGRNSITLANPSELQRNQELPIPYISELKLSNRIANPASYNTTGKLELSYRENFISIYFSAKAYTMPDGLRFRYRLKEFDDWTESTNNRLANYTNVPPGDYVFQLQAANNEGIWNEKIFELPLHIATPWWQTWFFRISAVLVLAGVTYKLYRYRIEQVRKKEKIKTQYEKKLANVEMTALLAQMNPHFLFNSLNSIDSYIIRNESGKASEYLNNFARLIRLILQNSRSNYISLKDELETLDLYLQMESLRFKDKFQYEIQVADGLDISPLVIPPMLIQPYVENAIWHGIMHKKDGVAGKVSIIIRLENNNLVCVVEDNGIGREKALELKMQKPGNKKRSMAMQITNERIEMINKLYDTNTSVQVIDLHEEGGRASGTRVELIIPV